MWTPGVDPTAAKNRRLHRKYQEIERKDRALTPQQREELAHRSHDGEPDCDVTIRQRISER